jgi:drug/metabolite transporter (DMT)-like permease
VLSLSFIYAILAAFLNALSKIVFRSCAKCSFDRWTFLIYYNLVAGILLSLLFGIPELTQLTKHGEFAIWLVVLSSGSWAFAGYLDLKAMAHLDVVTFAILGSIRHIFLAMASVVIFDETVNRYIITGIALILLSNLITVDFKSPDLKLATLYRLVSLIFINVATLSDKAISEMTSPGFVCVSAFILPALIYFTLSPKKLLKLPTLFEEKPLPVILAPIVIGATYILFVLAFTYGDLVIAASLLQIGVVFTWILGWVFLKERSSPWRKLSAALLCCIGGALLAH